MLRRPSLSSSLAVLALVVALATSSFAAPALSTVKHLFTGRDVKDGSLRAKHLAKRDGAALAGARGPTGPAGPAGAAGAAGPPGDAGFAGTSGLPLIAEPSFDGDLAIPNPSSKCPNLKGASVTLSDSTLPQKAGQTLLIFGTLTADSPRTCNGQAQVDPT